MRRLRRSQTQVPPLLLSFESWDRLPVGSDAVVLCHPDWRGVRSAAIASGAPRLETSRPDAHARSIVDGLVDRRVRWLVVHGYPDGADVLLERARSAGIRTACILHSSPTQHGGEPWEAAVVDRVLQLAETGSVERVGFVKFGVAESLASLGYPVVHVPNRAPTWQAVPRRDLGRGTHIGVFAEPIFRKNLVPQILAAAAIPESTIHVLRRPDVRYLDRLPIREHGVLAYEDFRPLLASVDLNLQVTLSECHPMTPMESYLAGVPCLISPTSELFRDDERLTDLTVVTELDNPAAIGEAASRLVTHRDEAIDRARSWIQEMDRRGGRAWSNLIEAQPA